jgi:hypothetical protein
MKRQRTERGWAPTVLLGFAIASLAAATMTSYVFIGQDAGRDAQAPVDAAPPAVSVAPQIDDPIVLPAPSEQPAPEPRDGVKEITPPVVSSPAVVAQVPPADDNGNDDAPESFQGGLEGDSGEDEGTVGGTVTDVLDRGQVGPSDSNDPDDSDDNGKSKGKGSKHSGTVKGTSKSDDDLIAEDDDSSDKDKDADTGSNDSGSSDGGSNGGSNDAGSSNGSGDND